MQNHTNTVGAVARQAGVNVETIRYYQRIGLIREPARPQRNVRRYLPETVERFRFIKRARELGFTLDEVTELLRLNDGVDCGEARDCCPIIDSLSAARPLQGWGRVPDEPGRTGGDLYSNALAFGSHLGT